MALQIPQAFPTEHPTCPYALLQLHKLEVSRPVWNKRVRPNKAASRLKPCIKNWRSAQGHSFVQRQDAESRPA